MKIINSRVGGGGGILGLSFFRELCGTVRIVEVAMYLVAFCVPIVSLKKEPTWLN